MGDNLVLRFQYKGKDTDVIVDDVDKVNLLDLIHDFWDAADVEQNPVPKYPQFTYLHKMKHEPLSTDVHLLKMFTDLPRRDLIHILVGESDEPSPVMQATMNLRQTYQSQISQTESTQRNNKSPLQMISCDVASNKPPLSPNAINNAVVNNIHYWNSFELEPFESDVGTRKGKGLERGRVKLKGSRGGKGEGKGREARMGSPTNDPKSNFQFMPTPTITLETSQSSNMKNPCPLLKKKVPKTTAKRKGVWVSGDNKKRIQVVVDLSQDLETLGGLSDVDDGNNVFHNERELDVIQNDVAEDDVAPEVEEDVVPVINDEFDAFEGPIWEDDYDVDFDNYIQRLYNNGEFYQDDGNGVVKLKPWLLFSDKQQLRDVIREYCIKSGFSVVVQRAGNQQYTIRCSDESCAWRLHASKLVDGMTWAIKSVEPEEHSCLGIETDNPMADANWASKVLIEDIRANNDIPGKALNQLLWERYKIDMKKSTLYRAKKRALYEIHGGYDVSYQFLPNDCDVVINTNPNSIAHCSWFPSNHPERPLTFKNIFICLKACVDGVLAGCRGVIGVDGTFLKGNYGGVLLSAIALDGNNEMFPLAWGIGEAEDEDTWRSFVFHLKSVLQPTERGNNWCIISNMHKAIEKACTNIWPEVGRRYCAKHLSVNWKQVYNGPKMWQLFWLAAGAYSDFTFGKAMEQIEKNKPSARIWLANLGSQVRWSKHKFNTSFKSDVNTTNFVESFNATLGTDRSRPILTLLENLRRVTMVRLATRRELCDKWDRSDICPNIVKRVQVLCSDSRTCRAFLSSKGEYEIGDGKSQLPVSLNNHTCLCNQWQLTGIPCKHGMRAILHAKLDPMIFVHEWYSVKRFKMAYGVGIKPIPDKEQWPQSKHPTIEPPVLKRGVGRPVKNRRRGEEEQRKGKRSKTYKCGRCGEFGHNVNSCQNGPTRKQKKSMCTKGKEAEGSKKSKKGGAAA